MSSRRSKRRFTMFFALLTALLTALLAMVAPTGNAYSATKATKKPVKKTTRKTTKTTKPSKASTIPTTTPTTTPTTEATIATEPPTLPETATAEVNGLRFTLQNPIVGSPGKVLIDLKVTNTGATLRRLYTPPEPFRFPMHFVSLRSSDGALIFAPESRPHGIVITENDFLQIAPSADLTVQATLNLPKTVGPGNYVVRWQLSNDVTEWKGGVQTLDGPTKTLFDGKPIPGIWTGKAAVWIPITL